MNETIQTILSRRSVRAYTGEPVSREDLETIVQCGLHAATAMGRQPWHLTVVTDRGILDRISAASQAVLRDSPDDHLRELAREPGFDNFRGAPCAVILSAEDGNPFGEVDCANATQNMAVAAKSLGIGSCYIASFRTAMTGPEGGALKELLRIPAGFTPVFALCLGYAAEGEPAGERAPRRSGAVTWL